MLIERWQQMWDDIRRGPTRLPSRIAVPTDHVAWGEDGPGAPFQPNEDYFVVRVNELYLAYSRQWFAKYDPMVMVVSEFIYDKEENAVPFVVGPSLLESRGQETPAGMIFSDTRVAGLHPYRGGRLALSVVLSQVERENYAKNLLQLVENAARVLDFATALSMYVKIASVVFSGVQALFAGDGTSPGATPVIGHRMEIDPQLGDDLSSRYFALIDAAEDDVRPEELWVRDHHLHRGESLDASTPFRDADYVLYSIVKAAARNDERTLPFYPLFERVKESATSAVEADWKRAKGDMTSLWQSLVLSPDLTDSQAIVLAKQYRAKLEELLAISTSGEQTVLGGGGGEAPDRAVAALREAAEILDL